MPRNIPGISSIGVLIVDDGSTDDTRQVAVANGAHYIVSFPKTRGLAAAFLAGIEAAVELGADVIVNTDADNQYDGRCIAALVRPLVDGVADVVVGDRCVATEPNFSPMKRLLQRFGSWIVSAAAGVKVGDCTSGFRAMTKEAASRMFVHNDFTYTLETLLQCGQAGLAVSTVPVTTNAPTRRSRLFRSVPEYLYRNVPVILRSYAMYHPGVFFGAPAAMLLVAGTALVLRFMILYLMAPHISGHIQSLSVGLGLVILGTITMMMAVLGTLVAGNRRLSERTLALLRLSPSSEAAALGPLKTRAIINVTGAKEWRDGNNLDAFLVVKTA